jgi:uncharacterized protein with HEPN domain
MSKRVPKILIEDILEAIGNIEEFTISINAEVFISDKKTQHAVIRNLEILGEASNRIPKVYRDTHPEVEWNRIIRTRHILIHEYDNVNLDILWRIITVHLPELKLALRTLLNNPD